MINKEDLDELNRIVTNTYDHEKAFVRRIITGIAQMDKEIRGLKAVISELKKRIPDNG